MGSAVALTVRRISSTLRGGVSSRRHPVAMTGTETESDTARPAAERINQTFHQTGDAPGMRITAFVTNTRTGQLPDRELRHRRRAGCEDRIWIAKDTGLHKLPLKAFTQNQIWRAVVALATDLLAWMGMLALPTHEARGWEPKRIRLRLFTIPAEIGRAHV